MLFCSSSIENGSQYSYSVCRVGYLFGDVSSRAVCDDRRAVRRSWELYCFCHAIVLRVKEILTPPRKRIILMVFLRLSCAVCSAVALHVSHTPPNPHPNGNANHPTGWERYFMIWIICTKYLTWAGCAVNIIQRRDDVPLTLVIGTLLSVCGALLRLRCFHLLGRRFTFQLATHYHSANAALVTTGPYAIVRHPSYVAGMLCFAGACLVFLRPHVTWVWTALAIGSPLPPLCARVGHEEALLSQEFGAKWQAYCIAVPRRVLPGIL